MRAWLLALALLPMDAHAQKKPPQTPDPGYLEELTVSDAFTLGRPFHFRWSADGALLFLRSPETGRKNSLWEQDPLTGQERLILSPETLSGEDILSDAEKALRERLRIKTAGFTSFELSPDGAKILVRLSGKLYLYERKTARTAALKLPKGVVQDPKFSPDSRHLAMVVDYDLWVAKLTDIPAQVPASGLALKLTQLTKNGSEDRPNGVAEFIAQEEMSRYSGYWWSADGEKILYQNNDYRAMERFALADAAAPEKSVQSLPYPRPGKNNAEIRLFVVRLSGDRQEIHWDRQSYPYLARVHWPQGRPAILVQSRDQKKLAYLQVTPKSGKTHLLWEEIDDAWLNLSRTTPAWLPDGQSYLWAHEREGSWALERHQLAPGKKGGLSGRTQVVGPEHGYQSLVHLDAERGWVWFLGGPDPRESHLYRVSLGGGAPQKLTQDHGEYAAVFSKDGSRYALTQITLGNLAESTIHTVAEPEPSPQPIRSTAANPRRLPQVELVPPDKAGGFFAAIVRPRGFEPGRKYPVILYVYGGPGVQLVKANISGYFVPQWFADHGFVVISLDGRGTPRRGRTHERALKHGFGEVPLDDQVAGLNALAEHYPEIDLSRVGTYGWSFGGYLAALAVLKRPDVFRAAVAGAPVTDWLYYDTHYTERYMGVPADPSDPHYHGASLVTHAHLLQRPLLLIHGIADDNVYFAHTLQLADALFKAGRPFELVPLVGHTHQVADPKIRERLYRRIVDFLGAALW